MVTSGFFNAVDGDRKYSAESFNDFFEGLISKNGIFESVGDGFKVVANTGMTVNVSTGKAVVNGHWVKNDAASTVTISAAHSVLSRIDAIVLRHNVSSRTITIEYKSGTAASSPIAPEPTRDTSTYEIILAYITVISGQTTITPSKITDMRYDTDKCGVVTGLIKQVNTTTLYNQYAAHFNEIAEDMNSWKNAQQTAFDTWFEALTDELNVNTYIERSSVAYTTPNANKVYNLPTTYASGDLIDVYLNNIVLINGVDYTVNTTNKTVTLISNIINNQRLTLQITKSVIGWN